jgi:cell division protein FtsL
MIRPTTILITLLAVSLSLTLFVVKYRVQDMEAELVQYNRTITEDRQAIHVLKAEWSHLNQPSRLRQLAERYLGMAAVEPAQVGTAIEFFSKLVPMDALSASAVTIEDGQSVMPLTAQIGAGESKQ